MTGPTRLRRRHVPLPFLWMGAVFAAASSILVLPGSVGAAPTAGTTPPQGAGRAVDGKDLPWVIDPRVDPDLSAVAVDSAAFNAALGRYRLAERNLASTISTRDTAIAQLVDLEEARTRLDGDLTQARRRLEKADLHLAKAQAALRTLAVDDYVQGANPASLDVAFDVNGATDRRRQRVLVRTVRARALANERFVSATVDGLVATIDEHQAELTDVEARISRTTAVRDSSERERVRLETEIARTAVELADARLSGNVSGTDFSFVALDAYYKAAKRMAADQPTCRVRWTLIAAVSRTEGWHGTYGGSSLDADGNETKPILGIALDGSPGIAAIGDTDGGAIDSDPTTDRAVGPMQFIPGTWRKWGRDGNLDGVIDPQNMYDATLAAASYLCNKGPGLDAEEGMRRGLYSYNASVPYGDLVISRAKGYDEVVLPPPPPTTPQSTTGAPTIALPPRPPKPR